MELNGNRVTLTLKADDKHAGYADNLIVEAFAQVDSEARSESERARSRGCPPESCRPSHLRLCREVVLDDDPDATVCATFHSFDCGAIPAAVSISRFQGASGVEEYHLMVRPTHTRTSQPNWTGSSSAYQSTLGSARDWIRGHVCSGGSSAATCRIRPACSKPILSRVPTRSPARCRGYASLLPLRQRSRFGPIT